MWISLMNQFGISGKTIAVTIGCVAVAGCAAACQTLSTGKVLNESKHASPPSGYPSAASTVPSGSLPSSARVSSGSSSSGILSSPSVPKHFSGSSVTGAGATCGEGIVATYGIQRLYLSSCAGNIGLSVYGPSQSIAANLASSQTAMISGPLKQIITGQAQSSNPNVVAVVRQTSSQIVIVAGQAGSATIAVPTPYCNGSPSNACALLRVIVRD